MPTDHDSSQRGGVPQPYPGPLSPPPAQNMDGVGAVPMPADTTKGAVEKERRAQAYRTLGTS